MRCSHCKTTTGKLVKVAKNRHGVQYYLCNECNTARVKKYRANGGMPATYRAAKRYTARNPERHKAWVAARKIPLAPCEVCGQSEHVHRHHDDPANKLDVMFLCPLHHKERHAFLRHCEGVLA